MGTLLTASVAAEYCRAHALLLHLAPDPGELALESPLAKQRLPDREQKHTPGTSMNLFSILQVLEYPFQTAGCLFIADTGFA